MLVLLQLLQIGFAYGYIDTSYLFSHRREFKRSNFNQTFFSSLESYQVNAVPVSEVQYPWISRVVHSRSGDSPHVCTASCVDEGIFITAARCIIGLKVKFTTVIYQSRPLAARAFVVPSNGTKQAYDDIGFIVVHKEKMTWSIVKLFSETNRTDDEFLWFEDLKPSEYKVVGYATDKGIHRIKSVDRIYNLTELNIVIGIDICSNILTFHHRIGGFNIPCYHSCTTNEFKHEVEKCQNYHGVEGGAVFDVTKEYLLGVATWGPYFRKYELPVGFSVVNSGNFFQDFECARKIWADDLPKVDKGYYQKLCDGV